MTEDQLANLQRTTREGLEMCMRWARADFLPQAVGGAGRTALGQAATALVLGLEDEAWPVVRLARTWLTDSAQRDERMGDDPDYFAMLRAEALGLAAWLLEEQDAPRHLANAFTLHQRTLAGRHVAEVDMLEMHLPDLVRDAALADWPQLGAEAYRRLAGPPPDTPKKVGTPVELAGWLAGELSRLRPPAAWVSVGERVLRGRLLDWLDRGHGLTAALWVWLVYFAGGAALAPLEAMRIAGELVGARPADPLGHLLRDSLGDPVDLDLFTGFLSVLACVALQPGTRLTAELTELPPVTVVAEEPQIITELDRAVRTALTAYDAPLEERLACAVRGRLVASDGETPVGVERISLS